MTYPYAVIIADPNQDGIGEIVSQHRSIKAAEAALDKQDSRWAYLAQRKADGEWETRIDARNRREGNFPTIGRPATLTGGRRVNVYLDDETIAAATRIGSGNLSEGIRAAVRASASIA